jgi:hypothetical protein
LTVPQQEFKKNTMAGPFSCNGSICPASIEKKGPLEAAFRCCG